MAMLLGLYHAGDAGVKSVGKNNTCCFSFIKGLRVTDRATVVYTIVLNADVNANKCSFWMIKRALITDRKNSFKGTFPCP